MTTSGDAVYFGQREVQERELAAQSLDPAVAAIHTKLANEYFEKAGKVRPKLHAVHRAKATEKVDQRQDE
jgi:hypothetical protein